MAKEIVKEDIQKIEQLISDVVGYNGSIKIERMGGLTNHSYRVILDDGQLIAVRIPGDGTEGMIDRSAEHTSTQLAGDLNIDAPVLYFGEDGSKVTTYIPDAVTMSRDVMQEPEKLLEAARVFRTLHNCGVDTGVPFEVFDMAAGYERIINDNNVYTFDDYGEVKQAVMAIKEEIDRACNPKKVPCHNDPLCENWVLGSDRMYLIDWEYAGMNDGMWDVADVSIEAEYDEEQDATFLKAYLDTDELDTQIWKHFLANKIYVDFLWTLWAKTRVPYDGQPMEDWAAARYERLKNNIEAYNRY